MDMKREINHFKSSCKNAIRIRFLTHTSPPLPAAEVLTISISSFLLFKCNLKNMAIWGNHLIQN